MLTLATGDTLAGVADVTTSVVMTVFGMELNGTTEAYKVLQQGALPTSAATQYTAPPSNTAFIRSITVVNTDAAATHTFQLFRGGTVAANAITPVLTIPISGMAVYEDGQGWNVYNSLGQALGQGATGPTGATGLPGAIGLQGMDGEPAADPLPALIASGSIGRNMLAPDAKNWCFLGTATGATTTVGPIVWTGQFQQIMFYYLITGYNGGTPVGRVLCGGSSISTTAATNGNGLISGVTTDATSVSVPGCPLAVTLSSIGRQGWGFIVGSSGSLKQINIFGINGNPAVGTSPTLFSAGSFFSDLGTNLLLQRLQLTVYDTLTATTVSSQTFNSGTQLWAWGRFSD